MGEASTQEIMSDLVVCRRSDTEKVMMISACKQGAELANSLSIGHAFDVKLCGTFNGAGSLVSDVQRSLKRVRGDWFAVSSAEACAAVAKRLCGGHTDDAVVVEATATSSPSLESPIEEELTGEMWQFLKTCEMKDAPRATEIKMALITTIGKDQTKQILRGLREITCAVQDGYRKVLKYDGRAVCLI